MGGVVLAEEVGQASVVVNGDCGVLTGVTGVPGRDGEAWAWLAVGVGEVTIALAVSLYPSSYCKRVRIISGGGLKLPRSTAPPCAVKRTWQSLLAASCCTERRFVVKLDA